MALTSLPGEFAGPPNFIHLADLSPDGERVAAVDAEDWIHIWELATGERLGRIDFSWDGLVMKHRPVFSPDGNLLAAKDRNGEIRLWDVLADNLRFRVRVPHDRVWPRAFTPDGRLLITSSTSYKDPTIRFWDVKTGEEVSRLSSSDETIATREARELLRRMAGGAPEAWPTREAKAALERLGGGAKAASGATPP